MSLFRADAAICPTNVRLANSRGDRSGGQVGQKKLLEAVADEERPYFNDERRRHSKFAVFFDLMGLGHEM
jgi:hypothetical protein